MIDELYVDDKKYDNCLVYIVYIITFSILCDMLNPIRAYFKKSSGKFKSVFSKEQVL